MSTLHNRFNDVNSDVSGFDYNPPPSGNKAPPPPPLFSSKHPPPIEYNYNPLPKSPPSHSIKFGQPAVAPTVAPLVPSSSFSFTQLVMVGFVVLGVYAAASVSYNWWFYNVNEVTFFGTTLPSILNSITLFTTYFTSIFSQLTIIQDRLNMTNGSISSDVIKYNGFTPIYSFNLTTVTEALDDESSRFYENVLSFSLTPSRFPNITFPTDQITVDEDVGRRLVLLENMQTVTLTGSVGVIVTTNGNNNFTITLSPFTYTSLGTQESVISINNITELGLKSIGAGANLQTAASETEILFNLTPDVSTNSVSVNNGLNTNNGSALCQYDSTGSFSACISAPTILSSNLAWMWPTTAGSDGQFLALLSGGQMVWATMTPAGHIVFNGTGINPMSFDNDTFVIFRGFIAGANLVATLIGNDISYSLTPDVITNSVSVNNGLSTNNGSSFCQYNADGTFSVCFNAASSLSSNLVWIWPTSAGTTGQVMTMSGGGQILWSDPAADNDPVIAFNGTGASPFVINNASFIFFKGLLGSTNIIVTTGGNDNVVSLAPDVITNSVSVNNGLSTNNGSSFCQYNAGGTFSVCFTAASSLSTNLTWNWPTSAGSIGQFLGLAGSNQMEWISMTLTNLPYTNNAVFMTNVTTANGALNNLVGEAIVQEEQIVTLQGQTTRLLTRKSTNYYVSSNYGNDVTCDASASLPCATINKTMSLIPLTGQFAQATIVFDNGLYVETSYVSIKPNVVFSGNEAGTLIIFGAGAGLDSATWPSVNAGFVSFLRFSLIRCDVACIFDQSAAAPAGGLFVFMRIYNSSIQLNAPMTFMRGTTGNPYFSVAMESVVSSVGTMTFQDLTLVTWSISGDIYSPVVFNYNTTTTFNSEVPIISIDGLVSHTTITVNNYASGLTVDWSIMGLINRDSATTTRNYVSGAAINIHGDILSLGAINGGLISTGAGSGTTEYLTLAPGLGYTPTTSGDWLSPVPTNQQTTNDQLAARATAITNSAQATIHVEVFGNDATCRAGIGYPCLTLNGALTVANALASTRISIQIGPGTFLNPPGNTIPFRCGLDITGRDANTYLELSNPTMDSTSMNTYASQCWVTFKWLQIAVGGTWNFTAVGTSAADWRIYMENITFSNSVAPVYFTGNSGFCWINLIEVSANGGMASLTFTDMFLVLDGIYINNAVNVVNNIKIAFAEIYGLQVGVGGFHVTNTYTGGASFFFFYQWSNLNTFVWDFTLSASTTSNLHGDATTIGMINTGSVYGPITSGAGTLTITRETGAIGLAYVPAVSGDWSPAPTQQQAANDQLASRTKALETLSSSVFYEEFTPTDVTCSSACTTLTILLGSGTKNPSNSGLFSTSGNNLFYNGSGTVYVTFEVSLYMSYDYGSTAATQAQTRVQVGWDNLFVIPGDCVRMDATKAAGATSDLAYFNCKMTNTMVNGDYITVKAGVTIASTTVTALAIRTYYARLEIRF